MCFNTKQVLRRGLKRAIYYRSKEDMEYYRKRLVEEELYEDCYQVSGFAHPKLITYTNESPYEPKLLEWGLIPHWTKDSETAKKLSNSTINARGETIFEKPSFRDAANLRRCIIPIDGFYEHHHYKGKKYPFYVSRQDGDIMNIAGLWSEWADRETGEIKKTCSIVTTKANTLMSKIHNNPKIKESRMPVIILEGKEDDWLQNASKDNIQQYLIPFPESKLIAHTVQKLSGKDALGNVPEANDKFEYEDLEFKLPI